MNLFGVVKINSYFCSLYPNSCLATKSAKKSLQCKQGLDIVLIFRTIKALALSHTIESGKFKIILRDKD